MTKTPNQIERLFPFMKKARTLIVGQHVILRSKSQLHFVLITHDISARGKSEALRKFKHYPIVQRYRSAELHDFFALNGVKLLGFRKSGLSKSLYAELKQFRINEPVVPEKKDTPKDSPGQPPSPATPPSGKGPKKSSRPHLKRKRPPTTGRDAPSRPRNRRKKTSR